jgi:hypothetical protein
MNFRYRFVNRNYSEWFGRPREEIEQQAVGEVLGQEMFEEIRPLLGTGILRGVDYLREEF